MAATTDAPPPAMSTWPRSTPGGGAANYLTVGQIYLQDNPLLREPLRADDIKPRLLGPLGHVARAEPPVRPPQPADRGARPSTCSTCAGPATAARRSWPTSTSRAPTARSTPTSAGRGGACAACSASSRPPAACPATSACRRPGSIHEGGELGYALVHAFGAAFDNPDLIVACVIGDGEAETGPLGRLVEGAQFLNPARDGAVLPILHLNGDKISGPTVLGRIPDDDVAPLLGGHGLRPALRRGRRPRRGAPALSPRRSTACYDAHPRDPGEPTRGRPAAAAGRPAWPAIVLRTPKGWTGPKEVDGMPVEGTFRAHQVPLADVRDDPAHLAQLEEWMRSYRPEELFDDRRRGPCPSCAALRPARRPAHGRQPRTPTAAGCPSSSTCPTASDYAVDVTEPGAERAESTRRLGELLPRRLRAQRRRRPTSGCSAPTRPTPTAWGRCSRSRTAASCSSDDRHRRPRVAGRPGHGGAERAPLPRLAGGLHLTGRHGAVRHLRGVRDGVGLDDGAAHQVARGRRSSCRGATPVPSLNILLTSTCWRNDHNGFSHQGPGLIDTVLSKRGAVAADLPAARRQLPAVGRPTTACAAATT